MPKITFLPDNAVCEVDVGVSLQTVAEQAGVTISFPCAGKGFCGKCLVKVEKGSVDFADNGKMPEELRRQGFVLACRTTVTGDAEILVTSGVSDEQGQFSDAMSRIGIEEALFPQKEDVSPLVRVEKAMVAPPEMLDGLGDYDRFCQGVKLTLGLEEPIELPLNLLRRLPDVLREKDGEVYFWYALRQNTVHIVDISAEKSEVEYGLAVDIGTTTVALQLVNIAECKVMDTLTLYNAQIDLGGDVISRISYAKTPERIQEMRSRILSTINKGIATLCEQNDNLDSNQIRNVTIGANTTMVQLFMGINPNYIRLEPYTPAVMGVPLYTAHAMGLKINPLGLVWMAPNIGSYVGGDVTAGLMCTELAPGTDELCLFIDIGTNGEIVLGNNDFLLSCACSAGPAFEGGGIQMGMRASQGAIEGVDIDPATGECSCAVIGGGKPKGICGSGLISLVAQLLETGLIDPQGKFDRSGKYASINGELKNARYYMVPPSGDGDLGVFLTENDLDNFIRAKAAIFSACVTMLKSVEMEFDQITKFYIAGGFGRYINVEKSQVLGLLPQLDEDKFLFVGNSSLVGSFMALLSEKHREKITEMANRITYIDLSTEPSYMDEYVAAMFLPHTDMRLFQKNKGEVQL